MNTGLDRKRMAVAAAATAAFGAAAAGQQMTFESLAHDDSLFVQHGSVYEESGFRLETSVGQFGSWGMQSPFFPDSTALATESTAAMVTLTAINGAPFDLLSIQIAKRDTTGLIFPVNVTFTGTRSDSSAVTATFSGTVTGVLLEDFDFGPDFTDLVSVTWQATQPHQFDNITLVPGPATAALVGFLGLGLARRRR